MTNPENNVTQGVFRYFDGTSKYQFTHRDDIAVALKDGKFVEDGNALWETICATVKGHFQP